jgi:hypothetical protein
LPARADEKPAAAYRSNFGEKAGPEWSHDKTDKAPADGRRFLGQFGNNEVSLSLRRLAPHKYVRASFDFYAIRSWDGSNDPLRECGPDVWSVRVGGGPLLVRATFASATVMRCDRQTFPDLYPGPTHPRFTGAAQKDTLGYQFGVSAGDAVYKMTVVFPHEEANLALIFAATDLEPLDNESWGLDNVVVELLGRPGPLGAERLQDHWRALGSDDPVKAWASLWEMVPGGDETVTFLAERLRTAEPNTHEVRRLAALLDAEDWKTRERATQELLQMGPAILPILQEIRTAKPSPEALSRIEWILDEARKKDPSRMSLARHLRAVHLLDVIGTPKARRLLADYAQAGVAAASWPASAATRASPRSSTAATQPDVRRAVAALLDQSRADLRALRFDEAALLCVRSTALAKSARSSAEEDALALLARVMGMQVAWGEVEEFEARFRNGDQGIEVRTNLLVRSLGDLDSPGRAAVYVGPDLHPEWSEYLEWAAMDPGKPSAAQCLKLAEWYRQQAGRFGAVGIGNMLERSRTYYENYLRLQDKPDPSARENLKDVHARLTNLGHFPPKPLLRQAGT